MMFRFGKIVESGNKSSRSDRFAEMSKQQQLIESKKQEIKAKFEEMKRKAAGDGSLKSDNSGDTSKSNKDTKSSMNNRMQSWMNDDRWRKKASSTDVSGPTPGGSDLFSNDGSFLEKYKRMAGTSRGSQNEEYGRFDEQSEENASTLSRPSTDGISYSLPNMNILPATSSLSVTSQAQSLYPLTARPPPSVHTSLAAMPASMPVLSAVPSSTASLQTVSLIQVPVSVPASSVILSCPIETTLVSSEPVVHLPVVHSTLSHSSVTVPLQTTVIPAQIQITSSAPPVQAMQINQPSTNVLLVPPECITQSPAVSATLPNTNVPPPVLPVPPPQPPSMPPPMFSAAYSMPPQSVNTNSLPPMHLPPPNFNPIAAHYADGVSAPPTVLDCKASMKLEKNDFGGERTLITSEAEERYTVNISRQREGGRDSSVGNLEDIETAARLVADCGDATERILSVQNANDEKWSFLHDKQSPPYIAFRAMVEKFRREKAGNGSATSHGADSNRSCVLPERKRSSRTIVDDDDSDDEEPEERHRKRRKRRSRWAPEDTKVNVPAPVVVNPTVGVAAPLSLGGIVPVTPPTQQTKLPGMSGSLISQVTRTDPALLQYALKAFGTVNLSEEDWKKAEDHYKINLLYQDMLKKRQELEKLEAAGKHKYAYDSDEDTEGGTWEHKLRQQEMVATKLWADELTERSKGKHHIGDFLPPDELERFMEKYNALKQGREPDLSDYKEFKLKEDNIGFQMLQKLGWSEGQGLGSDGSGIVNPVNKAPTYTTSHGLGIEKPDDVRGDDDEYDAYRKRMMLAYRFRPNPLNNPRRPYY